MFPNHLFFCPHTNVDDTVEVCQILDIVTKSLFDKYSGLSSMIGVDTVDYFRHIQKLVNG